MTNLYISNAAPAYRYHLHRGSWFNSRHGLQYFFIKSHDREVQWTSRTYSSSSLHCGSQSQGVLLCCVSDEQNYDLTLASKLTAYSPIFTYGGRATLKPGVRPDEHAIAYSSVNEPEYLPGEASMSKQPICIVDTPGTPPLHKASRIYFGIHHPIQYNVKVKDLGHVHPSDLVRMRGYWAMSNQDPSSQGIEVTSATPRGEVQQNVTPASPAYTNHTSPAMRVQPLQRSQPTVPVDENQNEDEDDEEEDEESVPPQLHSSTAYMHHTSPVMNVQQHQRAQPTIPSEEFGEEDEESSEDGEEAGERYIVR